MPLGFRSKVVAASGISILFAINAYRLCLLCSHSSAANACLVIALHHHLGHPRPDHLIVLGFICVNVAPAIVESTVSVHSGPAALLHANFVMGDCWDGSYMLMAESWLAGAL